MADDLALGLGSVLRASPDRAEALAGRVGRAVNLERICPAGGQEEAAQQRGGLRQLCEH